jgi:glycosyltransferase involved in cell wall biosynthesis
VRRLKVVFVVPSLHGGGAERAAITLLSGIPAASYDLTLYLFAREGPYLDQIPAHVRLVVGSRGRIGRLLALRRYVADERPDVVVSFLSHFTVYAAVRSARSGARYVVSQQTPLSGFLEDADYHWRRPLNRRVFETVARTVYPAVDVIAATSSGVADDLVANFGVRREQIKIVHNPVDVSAVEARAAEAIDPALIDDDRPTIVTAGRLADAKNLPLLVASLERLAGKVAFRAWILGQGDLEGDLRRRVSAAGLEEHVTLLGFQANPWKFMSRATVFVLTSRYEGFGNVLIEAMACGLPVVSTASYGTRDIVRHEETGLLVERHEPEAVAEALERVLTEPGMLDRMRRAARVHAAGFAVSTVARQFGEALTGAPSRPVQAK